MYYGRCSLGIIGSRFASGILSNFLGWRGIYIVSFFLMLLGASFVLKNMNPNSENKEKNISYLNVIRSNIMATLEDRSVRLYCFYGFATMFSFTAFWTNIATYLDQSLDFSTTEIALFSLLGY
ncbi:MFS transporter [Halomonas sp. PA16-9]|uniref:MFS transporter n=1 Tax=Halomonas sp. PA16-9 TaxID=2576841 RepID=UPI0012DA4954|nr:MFS transporter [Halomonas sp. PA16-9]